MMASVNGNVRRNVVPLPGALMICTEPFSRASVLRTTSMPTPRPEISVRLLGGT